ncbi:MAG: alkaline phosphatase family protein [Clostridia bacterium]|nr:alkaline phosphatase family protein [Clostridia bacterium]
MKRKIYKYCAVIGVDGMGNYNRLADTPNIDRIFANGATTYFALSMDPTISAENWGAMLLGASPVVHGLTNGWISQNEYSNKALPSVFTRIRRAFPEAYLTSVVNWDPINYGIVEHDAGVDLQTAENDEKLQPKILERIAKKPTFLFVQYDDVDGAGHGGGYGSERHLRQIETADRYIGELYAAYEKAGILQDTLFIVLADHGGIRNGHGGYTEEEKYIFFGVAGQNVQHAEIPHAVTVDIAALVLYGLGLEVPAYDPDGFSSQVPERIFPEYTVPYRVVIPEPRNVTRRETPAPDGENGLFSFFGREKLSLAMFFDNDFADAAGRCAFKEFNTVKFYSNGVNGACAEMGLTGFLSTEDLSDYGKGSFTVALWVNVDRSINEDCVVCGNRDWWWRSRNANGFTFVLKNNDTVMSLGCPEDHDDFITPLPEEVESGWVHVITAVDKEKKELRVYTDFAFTRAMPVAQNLLADNSAPRFFIGNDAGMENNTKEFPNIFKLDDLLLFNYAFTEKDARKLGRYYAER